MRYRDVVGLAVGFAFMYLARHGAYAIFAAEPFVRGIEFEPEMVTTIIAGSITLFLAGATFFFAALYAIGRFACPWGCYFTLLFLHRVLDVLEKGFQTAPARSE